MRICRLKLDKNDCFSCIDDQIRMRFYRDCKKCKSKERWYQIVGTHTSIFGKEYALIIRYDQIEKVPYEQIYNIKEVKAPWEELNKEN